MFKKKEKKQIEVIDMKGAKTVARKTSYITWVKRIFLVVTVVWLAFAGWAPWYVKTTYSEPIKKSIVVSMFFDIQRNIVEQYQKLLDSIKNAIDLSKPIAAAIDKVKLASGTVNKVTDTTAAAKNTTSNVKSLTGIAAKFGVNTGAVDNAVGQADSAIAKVDDTAKLVNQKLDQIESELVKVSQVQVDQMIDEAIKNQLDKSTGGLGTTLLTNYGIQHVYPWRPSSWPVAVKIYNDLEKSNVSVINILTDTVNKYFSYVAWGLVIAAWAVGLFIWMQMLKYYKAITAPFVVCPRCGHTIVNKKRAGLSLLKIFTPWKWFGI